MENGVSQLILCSSKACKGIAYWFHRKCCEIKRNVTFERVWSNFWIGMKFRRFQVFMRVFYEIQQSLNFRCQWYEHQNLKLLGLKSALSGLTRFLAAESPLKTMKNAFYSTSKTVFLLKIFKFLSWLFGHVAKRLDNRLISHFMTS